MTRPSLASGGFQLDTLSFREEERITEQLDRLSAWGAASAPLQVAQATSTQPRPGRKFFLCQSSCEPMPSEQVAKALRWKSGHIWVSSTVSSTLCLLP
jgi:hypothetical protein